MSNQENIILKEINQDWFDFLENWLYRCMCSFESINIPREDLEIYMPEYVLRMWQSYASMRTTGFYTTETKQKFYGTISVSKLKLMVDNFDEYELVAKPQMIYYGGGGAGHYAGTPGAGSGMNPNNG